MMNNLPMKSPAGRTPQKAYKHVKFMPLAHVRRVVDIRDNDGEWCPMGVSAPLTVAVKVVDNFLLAWPIREPENCTGMYRREAGCLIGYQFFF